MDGDRGDLAEIGKKRHTQYDSDPHYIWAVSNILILWSFIVKNYRES